MGPGFESLTGHHVKEIVLIIFIDVKALFYKEKRSLIMELWDAYNKDGKKLGIDLIRGQDIKQGLFHLVCEVVVRHIDGSYLMMLRDYNKDIYPGYYELGAGGSVLKGESSKAGAARELLEETGIVANNLILIASYCDNKTAIYNSYLCETDINKNDIVLQENETIGYKWISKDELVEFMNSESSIAHQKIRWRNYQHII